MTKSSRVLRDSGEILTGDDALTALRGVGRKDGLPVPAAWTPAYVGSRLVAAFHALDRLPAVRGPRSLHAGGTPRDYLHEFEDGVGLPTPKTQLPRTQNTSQQHAAMEEALSWPSSYCGDVQAKVVNQWAWWTASHMSVKRNSQACGWVLSYFKANRDLGLQQIAAGLARDRVPVT